MNQTYFMMLPATIDAGAFGQMQGYLMD